MVWSPVVQLSAVCGMVNFLVWWGEVWLGLVKCLVWYSEIMVFNMESLGV